MVSIAMSGTTTPLPNDPAALKAIIAALQAENQKMSASLRAHDLLVQALRVRIAKLQKQKFGASSEKIEREIEQLELALEDLQLALAEANDPSPAAEEEPDTEAQVPEPAEPQETKRRRPKVSKDTPRERRAYDPGENCPDCGGDLRVIGEDVSELIDMIAAQLKVIEIARIKKSCRRCEKIVQAPAPSRPIPRSMAGPNLLAYVLVSKFDDHVPLYRQNEIFARMGADIADTTLVDWCGGAMKALAPLIEKAPPGAVYQFAPDWKEEHVLGHLGQAGGILQADGYKGYAKLYATDLEGKSRFREAACWAHLRRDFHDVWTATKSEIAREAKVDAFRDWAEKQLTRIPGKSDLAKAFRYGLSRWSALTLFLQDGRVAIDNNAAERALRPIGVGRRNWLFAGSDAGGETLARALTVIETAKMNGLDPQAYLADVLDRIHDHMNTRLGELLPWNWTPMGTVKTEAA